MPIAMRWFYKAWYRWGTPPWVTGPRTELVHLVEDGTLRPGRAIDLGCGTGANAIYLARHGFDVIGVDYADSAIERARNDADVARVGVDFRVGDVTDMPDVQGPFDLIVDYGTYDDLPDADRPACLAEILRVSTAGTTLLMWCFEREPGGWHWLLGRIFGGDGAVRPGEVREAFEGTFEISKIDGGETGMRTMPTWAAYLMTRRAG